MVWRLGQPFYQRGPGWTSNSTLCEHGCIQLYIELIQIQKHTWIICWPVSRFLPGNIINHKLFILNLYPTTDIQCNNLELANLIPYYLCSTIKINCFNIKTI